MKKIIIKSVLFSQVLTLFCLASFAKEKLNDQELFKLGLEEMLFLTQETQGKGEILKEVDDLEIVGKRLAQKFQKNIYLSYPEGLREILEKEISLETRKSELEKTLKTALKQIYKL